MEIGKKKPQFQGVSVYDGEVECITGAMAERKGMDLVVYAHVPADPNLEPMGFYTIASTTPQVALTAIFQSANNLDYSFSDVKLAR